jgi:hypothetical protein
MYPCHLASNQAAERSRTMHRVPIGSRYEVLSQARQNVAFWPEQPMATWAFPWQSKWTRDEAGMN